VLTIRADVKVQLGFRPKRLHMGEIAEGQVVERSLELVGEEAADVKLLSADGGEKFEVGMVEEKGVAGKRMVKFTVALKPPFRHGKIHGVIEIETSHPKNKSLQLMVTGNGVGRFIPRLDHVYIRKTAAFQPVDLSFELMARGDEPFEVLSVRDKQGRFEGKAREIDKGRRYRIEMTIPAEKFANTMVGTIVVRTDDAKTPEVEVPFSAVLIPNAPPATQ
jgi:hypothetical protein